jgi:cell division protein FtsZ
MSPNRPEKKRSQVKFDFDTDFSDSASIKVVGIGGAGGNAVGRMIEAGLSGVDFLNINTDAQVLADSHAVHRIQIGRKLTKGLGSGGNPEVGRRAMEEDLDALEEMLAGADMVFVTAGMGGGTGTGAAPVIAELARRQGALTVAVVTKPFVFEGRRRIGVADEGLETLRRHVDTLITIPNQRLLEVVDPSVPFTEAFRVADDVLLQATRGISDLITITGMINLDFADVKSIMAGMGPALMGTGQASGERRAEEAALQAISCPLLEDVDIAGAQGVLINITGSETMTLHEITHATEIITEAVGEDANVIFGTVLDHGMDDAMRVTVIATGFGASQEFDPEEQENRRRELLNGPEESFAAAAGASANPSETMISEPDFKDNPSPAVAPEEVFEVDPDPTPVQVIEIVPEPEAVTTEPRVDEVAPILRAEAEAMKTEASVGLRPSQAQAEEWEVPTYLRKQND